MKKQLLLLVPILFLAACAQSPMPMDGFMQGAKMSGECPCCQKMMKGDSMNMGMRKNGKMQCSTMGSASGGGMKCGCCGNMMDGGTLQDGQKATAVPTTPMPVEKATDADHTQHHPAK